MSITRRRSWGWILAVLLVACLIAPEPARAGSCGPPPPAKPHRRKGGESFPPLPLPATPLRRTERKRPPAPPALVSKVAYGKIVRDPKTGRTYRDWTTDPGDMSTLLGWLNRNLKINYRAIDSDFAKESFNPAEIPIMYLTGHEGFELSDEVRSKLARFVMDGGYLLGDACCGSKPFAESFTAEVQKIFPGRPFFKLDADHPVFASYYTLPKVRYQVEGKGKFEAAPELYGLNIGCRTAVMLTCYDLSCGWSGHVHPHGARVLPGTYDLHLTNELTPYVKPGIVVTDENEQSFEITIPVGHVTIIYKNADGTRDKDKRCFVGRGPTGSGTFKMSGEKHPLLPGTYNVTGWYGTYDRGVFEIKEGRDNEVILKDKG